MCLGVAGQPLAMRGVAVVSTTFLTFHCAPLR